MSDTSPQTLVYAAYARVDVARVAPVVAALRERGFTVRFDDAIAHGSGAYVQESQQALREAAALVVFVSPTAVQSPWIEAETRTFQTQMARGGNRKLIAVRLDEIALPVALAPYTTVDAVGASSATVASTLAHYLSAQPEAPAAPVDREAAVREKLEAEADERERRWEAVKQAREREAAAQAQREAEAVAASADVSVEETPASAEPLQADESDADTVRGGWQEAPAIPATPTPPPAPVAPAPEFIPGPPQQPGGQSGGDAAPVAPFAPPAPAPTRRDSGAPAARQVGLEQVTFTAYHPKEMQPQQWQPLVVYISLDTPATLALVSAAAAERLAGKRDQFRPGRADKPAGLARGAKLRIIPAMPGFEFNPAYLDVTWQEDVQEHLFRMRATTAQPGRAANGVVQIYQGLLLRAEVPMSIFVGQAAARLDSPDAYAQAIARAYRRVFASYSHNDMPVVESCETAARTMGDQYLRDVTLLQAGTQWDPRLIQAINDADVFQLFWSKRAAASPYVEREWRHALQLLPARPNFIRPVYWSRQLYPAPPELNALHFQPLSLASLGWGWLRRTLYDMGNG